MLALAPNLDTGFDPLNGSTGLAEIGGLTAVPEPVSALVMLVGGMLVGLRKRRLPTCR